MKTIIILSISTMASLNVLAQATGEDDDGFH
jgi:hypothetical protein